MFFKEGGGFVGARTEKESPELAISSAGSVGSLLAYRVLGQRRDKDPVILINLLGLLNSKILWFTCPRMTTFTRSSGVNLDHEYTRSTVFLLREVRRAKVRGAHLVDRQYLRYSLRPKIV